MEQYTKLKTVTPELAQQFLDTSLGNRSILRGNLRRLQKIIIDNKWFPECSPILFDVNGRLIDGHHRLTAVVTTGKPVDMWIIYNARDEARFFIDTGAKRSFGQQLQFLDAGIKYHKEKEAIIRKVNGLIYGAGLTKTFEELFEIYEQIKPYLDESLSFGKSSSIQTALMIGRFAMGLQDEIITQITTGYDVKPRSISDKIRRMSPANIRTLNTWESIELTMKYLEVIYRYVNKKSFFQIVHGDEQTRKNIKDIIFNFVWKDISNETD